MFGIEVGGWCKADAEPRWGSMKGSGGCLPVCQGRLAEARQPFAMMRKPFGLREADAMQKGPFIADGSISPDVIEWIRHLDSSRRV